MITLSADSHGVENADVFLGLTGRKNRITPLSFWFSQP